jgi:magnesium transporter
VKVLTIISPYYSLTFIRHYGMNFEYMPELRSSWGYPLVVTIMVVLGSVMLIYFKRRGWF